MTSFPGLKFIVCFRKYSSQSGKNLLLKALSPQVYRSSNQLAEFITENVVFHKTNDVLVVNKPYGISSVGYKNENSNVFTSERHTQKDFAQFADSEEALGKPSGSGITIEQILPHLAHTFDEPNLEFCTGLKRYVSGPVVLPCNPKSAKRLVESLKYANMLVHNKTDEGTESFAMHRALAICVGKPSSSSGTLNGYATFEKVNESRQEYIFVLNKKATIRQKKGQYAVPGTVHFDVLATKNGASLVELRFNKFARHIPRLAVTYLNSPILGDTIYQRRIINVSGQPELIGPRRIAKILNEKQFAPPELLQILDLNHPSDLNKNIPMFFHVFETIFPRYGDVTKKNTVDLIVRAPLSTHFAAMAKLLGFKKTVIKHLGELENDGDEPISTASKEFEF